MPKNKKQNDELEQQIAEMQQDLQRTRADFENYRKRTELEKTAAHTNGQAAAILKLLPIIDTIERATTHVPEGLKDNTWAQGIVSLTKQLEKLLETLNLTRIDAAKGTAFDPAVHEAIQFNEEAVGDKDIIEQELQTGYKLHGKPIRHAMVKVTKQ